MKGVIRGNAPNQTYHIDNRQVTKAEFDRAFPDRPLGRSGPGGNLPSCWPMRSDALGVHPRQVNEANDRNRRAGVGVTYAPDGTAVIPDRNERKKLVRLEGFHDRNGGYGD